MSLPIVCFGTVIIVLWCLTMTDTVDAERMFSRRKR